MAWFRDEAARRAWVRQVAEGVIAMPVAGTVTAALGGAPWWPVGLAVVVSAGLAVVAWRHGWTRP